MSTLPIPGDELPIPRCPGGCGGDAPLAFACPSCERPFHPEGPAAQCAKVMAIAEMRLHVHAAECAAHQKTIKTATSEHAALYAEARVATLYDAKVKEILVGREELILTPEERTLPLLALVSRRMREHREMTKLLGRLETPVVDMTPGGIGRKVP